MPTIHFVIDQDKSFLNFVIENKPRLRELSDSSIFDSINSEFYRRIMVNDAINTDTVALNALKDAFMQLYEQETASIADTFTEEASHFAMKFELFNEEHRPQLKKFFDTLHSFFGLQNPLYSVEVLLSPVTQSENNYLFKKLPSSFSGQNSKPTVILFPLNHSISDFNERVKMLFHELSHATDYQHTTSEQTKSKLYRLAEKKVAFIRSKIPMAQQMRDIDIIKILYEVIVNTLSHRRFGMFLEVVLGDTTLHGNRDKNWIENFKFDSSRHTIGDLQMVAAWKVLPYTREYFVNKKEVDDALFNIVCEKICTIVI